MQARVDAFIVVDVHGNFFGLKGLTVAGFDAFQISPQDVVALAGGDALGEFAVVIGKKAPIWPFCPWSGGS